jgi:hypothetical protein
VRLSGAAPFLLVATASITGARADEEPPVVEVDVEGVPPPEPPRSAVSGEEARGVAGAENDPTKVIPSLPGVGRPPLGAGDVVVWGADGGDSRVLVDGVPVPALYHYGGVRGVVAADAVGAVDLVPGGFGVERGNALGGLIHLHLVEPGEDGLHGALAVDTLDAGMTLFYRDEATRALAAGRYGYLDRLVAAVEPDAASLYAVPRYLDGVAAVSTDVGGARVGALVLVSADSLSRAAPEVDPSARESDERERTFVRAGVPISYVHEDGSVSEALAYWGRDDEERVSSFGGTPLSLSEEAWLWGLRGEHAFHVAGPVRARVGVEAEGRHASLARRGSLTLPGREGDRAVFGQEPAGDIATDAWHVHLVGLAPFGALDGTFGPLRASLGARADFTLTAEDRATELTGTRPPIGRAEVEPTIDPRAAVALDLGERLELFANFGVYHQPAAPADQSAIFGNPALGKARALVVSAGERLRILRELRLEVVGYHRALDELTARSRLQSPARGAALTQNGEGRSYGAQCLLQLGRLHGFSGWLAYTLGRSERKIDVEERYRLFDLDQTHVLSAVLGYAVAGWDFGARFRFASGLPRTPVVGSYFNAKDNRHEPLFGAQNGERLDDFWQLDLHAAYTFDLGPVTLELSLDVQNVTAHENVEELAFDYDYAEAAPITGLPTLAVAGARLSF